MISGGLWALDWRTWSLDAGFAFQVNSKIGTLEDNKEPLGYMFIPGASFFADWNGTGDGLYFRPGFWFSWGVEEVYQGIARPCDEAELSHMKVLGLMLDSPFGYAFRAGKVDIGLQGGPAIYARFPLYTAQEGDGEPSEFWTAYYGSLQFLYLGIAAWTGFAMSDNSDFLAGLRLYQPFSNLWTDAPFAHGMQIGLMAAVSFKLEKASGGSE